MKSSSIATRTENANAVAIGKPRNTKSKGADVIMAAPNGEIPFMKDTTNVVVFVAFTIILPSRLFSKARSSSSISRFLSAPSVR